MFKALLLEETKARKGLQAQIQEALERIADETQPADGETPEEEPQP